MKEDGFYKTKCPNCGNPVSIPPRDDSCPGFADIYNLYCDKCGAFLCSIRWDSYFPKGQGYGWTINGPQPGLGDLVSTLA